MHNHASGEADHSDHVAQHSQQDTDALFANDVGKALARGLGETLLPWRISRALDAAYRCHYCFRDALKRDGYPVQQDGFNVCPKHGG